MLGLLVLASCSMVRKVERVRTGIVVPELSIASDFTPSGIDTSSPVRDTLKVRDAQGREMLIMKAVRDENGEMVASDVIDAVVVTATFKNVAERGGKVDLRFDVSVPSGMLDSRWQVRLRPVLYMMGDSTSLEPVFITGRQYRNSQLKGYQRYERFLAGIVSDSLFFLRRHELELFLMRNMPELYAMRSDSSEVSEEAFESLFGVTGKEASEHYMNRFALYLNGRKVARRDEMFRRYVKSPLVSSGLRLDTLVTGETGDIVYQYVQTIKTRPGLRKAQIALNGAVYDEDRQLCEMPSSDYLTFYISSLSSFLDPREKYLMKVTERKVEANSICWIEFAQGSSVIDTSLGKNASEIGRIMRNIEDIVSEGVYDIDSIVVTASCSPEGSYLSNTRLSKSRSEAVCAFFDSLTFIPRAIPENWAALDVLVGNDTVMTQNEKERYFAVRSGGENDMTEHKLSSMPCYRYLRTELYPRLRTVRFNFNMHRKGMVKDTMHTTEIDTVYRRGVRALRDHDYQTAVRLLGPYHDFNAAVAYCALGYNASSMDILQSLPPSPNVEYLKAVIHSRRSEDREAIQCYINACNGDPALVHRGNLDPEITELTKKYNLK